MLASNLHQRQYVAQLQGILVALARARRLTDRHLGLLWGVTEQVRVLCVCFLFCPPSSCQHSRHRSATLRDKPKT